MISYQTDMVLKGLFHQELDHVLWHSEFYFSFLVGLNENRTLDVHFTACGGCFRLFPAPVEYCPVLYFELLFSRWKDSINTIYPLKVKNGMYRGNPGVNPGVSVLGRGDWCTEDLFNVKQLISSFSETQR